MKLSLNKGIIRIYGDSLSMPRIGEGICLTDTYPELLKTFYSNLWKDEVFLCNRSRFGNTITLASEDLRQDSLNFGKPGGEVLIMQIGICDCAPRPIPSWMASLIKELPEKLKNKVNNLIYRLRPVIQKIVYWRNTPPEVFRKFYLELIERYSIEFNKVYIINIPPSFIEIEKRSPGFNFSIELYNQIISNVVKQAAKQNIFLVDVFNKIRLSANNRTEYVIQKDGHHITIEGHKLYAQMIIDQELSELSSIE